MELETTELLVEDLMYDVAPAAASDAVGGLPCAALFLGLWVYANN